MARPLSSSTRPFFEKILDSLELSDLPSVIALNKKDRVSKSTLEALKRAIKASSARDVVSVSALSGKSLRPLVAMIGKQVSRDLESLGTPASQASAG